MQISVSASKPTPLPDRIREQVLIGNKYIIDLEHRLERMPEIREVRYEGTGPKQTPHDNAVKFAAENNCEVWVGYVLGKNTGKGQWKLDVHSFCRKNGKFIEPTSGIQTRRYVGMRVPKEDIAGFKYLSLFERMSYIKQNSELGLL